MKCFLAGGSGMLGRAILRLNENSSSPFLIRACSHNQKWTLKPSKTTEYIQSDLSETVDSSIFIDCDTLIMSAAITGGIKMNSQRPEDQINGNLKLMANIFSLLPTSKIKKIIFISSATVYQDSVALLSEDELDLNLPPPVSIFGVGWTFRYVEKLLQFWGNKLNLEVIILRAGNIFGPFDKFDPDRSNFIPALITKGIKKIDPFEIFGPRDTTRDLIYCDDLASLVIKCIYKDHPSLSIYNASWGVPITIQNALDKILILSEHAPKKINWLKSTFPTTHKRLLNCNKVKSSLDWKPNFTFDDALRITIDWWKKNQLTWTK